MQVALPGLHAGIGETPSSVPKPAGVPPAPGPVRRLRLHRDRYPADEHSHAASVAHGRRRRGPALLTAIVLDRLAPNLDRLGDLGLLRTGDVEVQVLLTRVRARTVTARTAREVLVDLGLPVFDAEIPLRESYAGAFGAPVPDGGLDYAAAAAELLRFSVVAL